MTDVDNTAAKEKALSLLETGQYAEAISLYHVICDSDENDAEAWHKLGLAYVRSQQNEEAKDCLEKAAALAPDNFEIQTHNANILAMLGDIDSALQTCNSLMELQPDSTEVLTFMGNLLAHKQDFDSAIEHLQKALTIDSSVAGAHAALAQVYAASNRIEEAKESATTAVSLDPTNEIATQVLVQLNNA